MDLPGSFFFLVEIICCVPDFLTILLHSFPFKIMSLVSLLTDFDYFWLCLRSLFLSIMVCPVRLLICCTSAPCSQLLYSGLFFVYVDSDPRSLLISFFVILGVACHVFDLC